MAASTPGGRVEGESDGMEGVVAGWWGWWWRVSAKDGKVEKGKNTIARAGVEEDERVKGGSRGKRGERFAHAGNRRENSQRPNQAL